MTRIEISCHHEALKRYIFGETSVKTLWHMKVQRALDHLVDNFLNKERVLDKAYRTLQLTHLITDLSRCEVNLLVVGRSYTWLINSTTGHPRHFVGTKRNFGLTHCANSDFAWDRIEKFVKRYAAVGSHIYAYSLHKMCLSTETLPKLGKSRWAHF